jgi:homoserine dehydrogenase
MGQLANRNVNTVDVALVGLGNVNRSFLRILELKSARLAEQYGLAFRVVCVADSSGVAVNSRGYDPQATRQHKENGGRVAELPGFQGARTPAAVLADLPVGLVLEASPVDLKTGEPGLSVCRTSLRRGIPVVLANKGPLVLAYGELQALAQAHGGALGYSATVCGALPVVNIGRRDLIAADIIALAGIFNATTNFILGEMATGRSFADALAEAQRRGIAETDPSLDIEGWDTANKLVIIANSFLGVQVTLADVAVQGITGVTTEDLRAARTTGNTIKLVACAERKDGGGYRLSVRPTILPLHSFLGQCDGWEMGIELQSDLYGLMFHKIWEREPLPTAAAMLRDAVNLLQLR